MDYQKLDGSVKKFVDIAIAKMQERAEGLSKKNEFNLFGCRKIKFKKIGIRIVYRIIGDKTGVILIGKRGENEVYTNAVKRLKALL